jgi:hypothetical protein
MTAMPAAKIDSPTTAPAIAAATFTEPSFPSDGAGDGSETLASSALDGVEMVRMGAGDVVASGGAAGAPAEAEAGAEVGAEAGAEAAAMSCTLVACEETVAVTLLGCCLGNSTIYTHTSGMLHAISSVKLLMLLASRTLFCEILHAQTYHSCFP